MQNLILQNIIPNYIENISGSDVYGKELVFEKGKYIHIEAPSGTGKTTLLHIIYGINNLYTGNVLWDNKQEKDYNLIRQNHLSVVFQDLRLIQDISVLDNIELKNQLTQHKSSDEIMQMLHFLDVDIHRNKITHQLSRGEQQRVAIVRALCMPFSFIILDEVMSHLDEQNRLKVADLIHQECIKNNASLMMLNLYKDNYFMYHSFYHL
jgi:putative ABC transport system ATP-binding protein